MLKWLGKLLGDTNEKELKRHEHIVTQINALEPEYVRLSEEQLRALTDEFKERVDGGESLDSILPEAFAAVREAAKRTIKQRHFDVQLMGGIVLHQGKIAEMKTGEGKTLVATLPVYLNALSGKGVHVITVNDYLAKRDPQWMGPIYHLLGVSVASVQHETSYLYDPEYETDDARYKSLRPISRYDAYRADITYGTNSEYGFDYLRDNMVVDLSQCVQRELNYAIVDEVDNILIDEARTPLIISGQAEEATDNYYQFSKLVHRLRAEEDYKVDEKVRAVTLTEVGIGKMERWLGLENIYDSENYNLTRYLENALKAEVIFKKDRDYVAKDGQVIIVDEFTGRLMFGRRYSEGLHQAIEAKEGLRIQRESITLATITLQNYFRMYKKLAGMTGTAATEAEEFHKIYKLDVVAIPTNKPMIRADYPDQIYKSEEAKFRAVVREIEEMNKEERPVLVGTVSIEKSERLSWMLQQRGIPHQVLNAKFHEKEAAIISQAGQPGAVTIATNMAGRGTDIVLGQGVTGKGGLHIIGTERHEARRIDNQLRGRSGRQGDPGSSRFYVSLEDDIMRRFGGDRIKSFMEWAGLDEDVPIEHGIVSKSLEGAQTKVEGYNFDVRKHLVDYDDVINKHRDVIYGERKKILSGADLRGNILEMVLDSVEKAVNTHLVDEHGDDWDTEGLLDVMRRMMPVPADINPNAISQMSREEVKERFLDLAESLYEQKEKDIGEKDMRMLERLVMLRIIDNLWVEHLTAMDDMREGISLRAVGQNDPLVAYKREAHSMFESLLGSIQRDIVNTIYNVSISREPVPKPVKPLRTNREDDGAPARARRPQPVGTAVAKKIGRNDPCPCGSGKKYKKCHGTAA